MAGIGPKGKALLERAAQVIPNGMYGHESVAMLDSIYPQFYSKAKGARLWDADGNAYVDMMCAYGPNLLGYQDPEVEAAAQAQARLGDTMTGPSEIMVDLAETMVSMIDHAAWAMFCKNGADATSMCMVTARAHTNKRKILIARGAYHGASPWNTPGLAGIIAEERAHFVHFVYDDLDSLEATLKEHAGDVAAVFATPFRHEVFQNQTVPTPEYAQGVRKLCDEHGAVLIADEVRTGFRLTRKSVWEELGAAPDLTSYGKVLGNGHPISVMVGNEEMRTAAGSIFVTGSFWFSAVPMAAALETLRQVRETDYLEKMVSIADTLRAGIAEQAKAADFEVLQTGPSQMPQILFADDPDMRLGYGFTATALRRGAWLHPYHNMFVTPAMTQADIDTVLNATQAAFDALRKSGGQMAAPHEMLLEVRTAVLQAAE